MTTLEQKTCGRCGDELRETVRSFGVLVDHFACGSIVYQAGESIEGLRCVRRQRDWLVAEVARLRAEGLKALCATADTGELAMNLTAEVDALRGVVDSQNELLREKQEVIETLQHCVEVGRATTRENVSMRKLWLELVVALRENWEDTPEHWREINSIIRRAEVCNAEAEGRPGGGSQEVPGEEEGAEAVPDQGADAAGLGGEVDDVAGDR